MELKNYFAQDALGNALPGATVHVYEPGTTTPVTGLQDAAGAPLANPFLADADALIQFAAPDGLYDLRVISGPRDYTIRVQCYDQTELANSTDPAKGSAKVGFYDPAAPAYLKTVSDILNGLPVHVNRFIPRDKHSAIEAGTNTDNLIANIQEGLDCGASKLILGHGVYNYDSDASGDLVLTLRPGMSMEGMGVGTILKNRGTNHGLMFLGDDTGDGPRATYQGSATRMQSVRFKDFVLEGNVGSLDGLNLQYTEKFGRGSPKLSGVIVRGHGRDGVYWSNGDSLIFEGCDLLYNGRHNLYVFGFANTLQFFGGNISGAKGGEGAYLNQVASTITLWGVAMHDNAGSALTAQRCEQPAMYSCGMNGNGYILQRPAVRLIGDATKPTESAIIKGCLFGDNNPTGADILTNFTKSARFENTYIYATNSAKPYIFRLDQESHGVVIEGTRWKITNGSPAKVSVVPGTENTVDFLLIDDEAQNATDGISDGSETKQVDITFNQQREVRPRFISNTILQTRLTGSENTPYWVQKANGRQEFCRNGDSANGVQYLELDSNGRLHSNTRFQSDLGFIAGGSDYVSKPLQAGSHHLWWDSFGKVRTKSSAPTSAQDGFPLGQKVTVPASATGSGAPGDWAANSTHLYVYVGDGTTHSWVRTALATW